MTAPSTPSDKKIEEYLDPSMKVARISMSSEHDMKPIYYDKDNRQIPWLEREVRYKPEYDFETASIKHWWFKNESTLYRDVYTEVAVFRSRNSFGKYWKCLRIWLFDKYIGRHF